MAGPLANIRVLDLSRIMAAPWTAQLLADLGADVIKVERPEVGDDTRSWGPPFLQSSDGPPTADAGYFLAVNRGKRSITIDIAKSEGQALIRELAKRCDIVLENYKYGTLQRYGLDYECLAGVNPRLIYASVTGFGQTGPRKRQVAYDFMVQAMGGLMSITGERDDRPGGGPQKVGIPIVDLMTGMYAAVAVLAALHRRAVSGMGDYIDLAMFDVQTAVLSNQAMNYLLSGRVPQRSGNCHPNIQPQDVFACRDGYLAVAVGNDGQFKSFAAALAAPELATDVRFANNAARVANLQELAALIAEALARQEVEYWVQRLAAAGVPCAPINSVADVLADPQIIERGLVRELQHPLAGTVPQVVNPIRYRHAPLSYALAPPTLGQHTTEVLTELGIDAQRQKWLADNDVI
jgi:crotonobetainyl-CoA:carnitine CoA-transferase CaiB-like acyl-CoA transferase